MYKKRNMVSLFLVLCVLISTICSVFADSSIKPSENKKVKVMVTKQTMTTDTSTGKITKVIEFTYEPDASAQSSNKSVGLVNRI